MAENNRPVAEPLQKSAQAAQAVRGAVKTGKAIADYITVHDETVDETKPLTIFDPNFTWKSKPLTDFYAIELQKPIFRNGQLVYKLPTTEEIRKYCSEQMDMQWDEIKRFENPHNYYVDLSPKLWDTKQLMLHGLTR